MHGWTLLSSCFSEQCILPIYRCQFASRSKIVQKWKIKTTNFQVNIFHTASTSFINHSTLRFWPYYMSWVNCITTPYTCVNNTSCNQLKVVLEPEIQDPRGKERKCGVDDTRASGSRNIFKMFGICPPPIILKVGKAEQAAFIILIPELWSDLIHFLFNNIWVSLVTNVVNWYAPS